MVDRLYTDSVAQLLLPPFYSHPSPAVTTVLVQKYRFLVETRRSRGPYRAKNRATKKVNGRQELSR